MKNKHLKIKNLKDLLTTVEKIREFGLSTVYVSGFFDVLHDEHIAFLQFAKSKADILIVGVGSDESARATKGRSRPINKMEQRLNVLAELRSVDYLFPIEFKGKYWSKASKKHELNLVKKIKPDFIVSNPNADLAWEWRVKEAYTIGAKFLPHLAKVKNSTTRIEKYLSYEI